MGRRQIDYPSRDLLAQLEGTRIERIKFRLRSINKTRLDANHLRKSNTNVPLNSTTKVTSVSDDDIVLIALTHNSMELLPAFFEHYRALGIRRFGIVDDQSTDGTNDFLNAQDDVDIFRSYVRYKDAARGKRWRERLFDVYGRNRWYLNVDIDEFLVLPTSLGESISEAVFKLESMKELHLLAPMIDLLPKFTLASKQENKSHNQFQKLVAENPLFKPHGYTFIKTTKSMYIAGGVQRDVAGHELNLTKYPLLFVDHRTSMGRSIHEPTPYWRNLVPPRAALLHFRYTGDYRHRFREAVSDNQYYDNGRFYRQLLERIEDNQENIFDVDDLVDWESADQLVSLGLVVET